MSREECEQNWFWGRAGTWNETLNECICPSGFSGRDDWHEWNSCHVDDGLAYRVRLVSLIACVVVMVLSMLGFVWVALKWDFALVPKMPKTISRKFSKPNLRLSRGSKTNKTSDTSSKHYSLPLENSTPNLTNDTNKESDDVDDNEMVDMFDFDDGAVQEAPISPRVQESPGLSLLTPPRSGNMSFHENYSRHRDWRRKRASLVVFLWFFAYGCSAFLYYLPFLLPEPMFRFNLLQNIGLAIAATNVLIGYYALVVSWYRTLPSTRRYGALLKMNPLIVKYPNLVIQISTVMSWFIFAITLTLLVLVPVVDDEYTKACDFGFLISILVILGVFVTLALFVCISVIRIFSMMLKAEQRRLSKSPGRSLDIPTSEEYEAYRDGIKTAYGLFILTIIAVSIALTTIILAVSVGERYIYLLWNTVHILASIACMLVLAIILFRTNGGLAPIESPRVSKRLSKLSQKSQKSQRKTLERIAKKSLQHISELELSQEKSEHSDAESI